MRQSRGARVTQEADQGYDPAARGTAPVAAGPSLMQTQDAVDRLIRAGLIAPGSRAHLLLDYLLTAWHRQGPVPVKAYAIALDVLGRGADFDPGTDSIVRVELGRLRKLLDLYYAGPGAHDPVRLTLPKGQSRIEATLQSPAPAPIKTTTHPAPRRWGWLFAAAVAGALAVGAALWTALPLVHPARLVVAPTQVASTDPALATLAEGLALHLASDLARFRTFEVVLAPPPQPALFDRASYRLESRIEPLPDLGANLTLVLIRAADGAVILSQTRRLEAGRAPLPENPGAEIAQMLGEMVQQIVGPRGALEADGRARLAQIEATWLARPPEEFLCLLRYQGYDQTKDETRRGPARACLRRLTKARSPVGAIWAAQSAMQLLDWSEDPTARGPERLAVALASAHRAAALDPGGADGPAAMGAALTAMGQIEAAEAALTEAARLSPHDPDIAMRRAWLDCLRGDWATGLAAITAELAARGAAPGWYRLPLALAALDAGDASGLAAQAEWITASGDRRGFALSLAATRLRADTAATATALAQIAAAGATPAQLAGAIARLFPDPELGARLQALAAP